MGSLWTLMATKFTRQLIFCIAFNLPLRTVEYFVLRGIMTPKLCSKCCASYINLNGNGDGREGLDLCNCYFSAAHKDNEQTQLHFNTCKLSCTIH